jgi:hypothetical protein
MLNSFEFFHKLSLQTWPSAVDMVMGFGTKEIIGDFDKSNFSVLRKAEAIME